MRSIRVFARKHPIVGYAIRGAAAAAVVAGSLGAAMVGVGVALVSPMYAFGGGSENVALGILVVAGAAALAIPVAGFLVAWAIWTVDLDAASARVRTRRAAGAKVLQEHVANADLLPGSGRHVAQRVSDEHDRMSVQQRHRRILRSHLDRSAAQ